MKFRSKGGTAADRMRSVGRMESGKQTVLLIAVIASLVAGSYIAATQGLIAASTNPLSGSTNRTPDNCLVEVPDNAIMNSFVNSTVLGTNATYADGKETIFPKGSCPQPAKAEMYAMASVAERDPKFIALENGSRYILDPMYSGRTCYSTNGTCVTGVTFFLYSDVTYHQCNVPGLAGKLIIGGIEVDFKSDTSGRYDISNPTVSTVPSWILNACA